MKLVRFGAPGAEKPGLVDAQGAVRDLSAHIKDITGDTLSPASLDKLRKIDAKSLPAAPQGVRLGAPVGSVRNFIAVGLNYVDHAKETGAAIPEEPILFNKLPNCMVGPNDDVMVPKGSTKLDYEIEIAFVIGTRARYVEEKNALSHIAGYCICNDMSERNFQAERGGQWMKGKCAETFGPLGPWLVDARRDRGRAGSGHVAGRQRRAPADRQHQDHDLRHRPLPALHLAVHGAGGRRRGDDRHAARRRARHEAAEVAQCPAT